MNFLISESLILGAKKKHKHYSFRFANDNVIDGIKYKNWVFTSFSSLFISFML